MGWVLIIYACTMTGCTESPHHIPTSGAVVCIMARGQFMTEPEVQLHNGQWGEARCAMESPTS